MTALFDSALFDTEIYDTGDQADSYGWLGGGLKSPYLKYKEDSRKQELLKEEADNKVLELQRQAEAKRLEAESKAQKSALRKAERELLEAQREALQAQEELQRLYALIAIEARRLDEEEAIIALMCSLPFTQIHA